MPLFRQSLNVQSNKSDGWCNISKYLCQVFKTTSLFLTAISKIGSVWVEPCAQDRREKTRARSENNAESRTPGRVCVCGENYAGPPDPFFSFKLVFLATERIPGRGGTHSSRQVCMRHSSVLVSKLITIKNRATNLWTPFRITMVPDKLSCYGAHLK